MLYLIVDSNNKRERKILIMNDDKGSEKMNDLCPNCGQLTNSSFSRLVKDACGHMKCRMCLLYEEQGCESCRKERTCNDFDYKETSDQSKSATSINKSTNDDTIDTSKLTDLKNVEVEQLELTKISNSEDCSKKCEEVAIISSSKDFENDRNQEKNVKKYQNKSHIVILSGDPEKYQCIVCNKIFRNKKCIHYHNSCATGIKPFQCTICDKSFINRSHFEYHERTHTGYKPFKCNLCDKAFPQRNKLNRHMTSHSNEKNFACSKCDKKYSKKADLQSHLYVHSSTTNSMYSCKSCGKAFGNITHLKRHSRAHSNERPHICERCNKSFKDKSLLVRHYKTHGKERPFTCAHCSRGFLTKSELRRHLTVHSDEKPFSCIFCQTVFRRKDNLNRHIRHHHSDDEQRANIIQEQTKSSEFVSTLNKIKEKSFKSKTKVKKSIAKHSNKSMKVTNMNLQNQINSRLDPMGNLTSVIRTTGEVSNAVPVINGPLITRRYMENNDAPKKTLNYMEPIPPEEAVVINKRIEAKLYPQSNISQNYLFHELSDTNDNTYLSTSSLFHSSLPFGGKNMKNSKEWNLNSDVINYIDTSTEKLSMSVPDKYKQMSFKSNSENVNNLYEEKLQNNYVSTIKKHTAYNN